MVAIHFIFCSLCWADADQSDSSISVDDNFEPAAIELAPVLHSATKPIDKNIVQDQHTQPTPAVKQTQVDDVPVSDTPVDDAPVSKSELQPIPRNEQQPLRQSSQQGDHESDNTHTGGWLLETLTALGIVLLLIYLLRAVMRKMSGHIATTPVHGLVEVLARTSIGPKTHVIFLKINERIVVVSQTPAGLNTLMTMTDPEEIAQILTQISTTRSGSVTSGFKSLMRQIDRSYQGDKDTVDEGEDTQEQYIDRTRNEVAGLLNRVRSIRKRRK